MSQVKYLAEQNKLNVYNKELKHNQHISYAYLRRGRLTALTSSSNFLKI